ncbi:MAG TPA: DUF2252 domain-containing protein [Streptosporangiaceae bacterium]|nr:DUF2252 domain-containing protein [Streptosporangiaceae bacterium]
MTDLRASYQPGQVAGGVLDPDLGRLTMAERVDRGKAARAAVPRESHAGFDPPANRPDPVAQLEQQAESRVPELVPIRYGRMLVSPFAYFRGAALPMASDLASTPCTGLVVQACGDAHLSNFGIFASPERKFLFDVNDFDETLPGPWEWDVKRLAASLEVAGRGNGFSRKQRRRVVTASTRMYRETMRTFAAMNNVDVWYARVDLDLVEKMFSPRLAPRHRKGLARSLAKNLAKARTRDSMQALGKLTTVVEGQRRIVSDPPLIEPVEEVFADEQADAIYEQVRLVLGQYRRSLQSDRKQLLEYFSLVQAARKVVGVGSVGTRAWILLMDGGDGTEPLFLQAKEAQPSVLAAWCGRSQYRNQGERVVAGQHLMQAESDIFLGWTHATGADKVDRDFYVRQLKDWKFSFPIEQAIPSGLKLYAQLCGWTLARAHARSGDRVALAAYLGGSAKFDEAIAGFAETYADQNDRDYAALKTAVKDGKAEATTEI